MRSSETPDSHLEEIEISADQPESGLSPRAELIAKVMLALIPTVFLLFMVEGGAYVWERIQAQGEYAWELVASRRIDLITAQGPPDGYTLMKPGASYEWQSIPVEINSHGLRNPEMPMEKSADTVRVLNLGDSIAMGWGVAQEETYGALLEQKLSDQDTSGQEYEVINAGVPGWNPENYLAFLKSEGLKYEPDLIVLDLTLVNDIFGQNALERQDRGGIGELLRNNTHIWPFMSIQMQWLRARSNGNDRISVIDPPTEARSYFPLTADDERWDAIWEPISEMNAIAEENNIPFVLLLFPLEHQVINPDFPRIPQEVFSARADQQNIPVIDLLPVYMEACETKAGAPCELEDRYLFADVWMHPSTLGHEITAQTIIDALDVENLQVKETN